MTNNNQTGVKFILSPYPVSLSSSFLDFLPLAIFFSEMLF